MNKKRLLLISFGSILLAISFAPFSLAIPAWIGFTLIFFGISGSRRPFVLGYIAGAVFYILLLYWIPLSDVGDARPWVLLGFILLIAYISLYYAVSLYLFFKMEQRGWWLYLWPLVFAGLEFFRSLSPSFGFPWGSIAYSQSRLYFMFQFADLGGIHLVTLWVLYFNLFLYLFIKRRKKQYFYFLIGLSLFALIYSFIDLRIPLREKGSLNVCILQPNIDPEIKRSGGVEKRLSLIEDMLLQFPGSDLYILPESASPCLMLSSSWCRERFIKLSDTLNAGLVVGTQELRYHAGRRRPHNSSVFLFNGYIKGVYRKIYLVPFVERLPFNDVIPSLNNIDFGQGDFIPGKEYHVFNIKGLGFSTPICYEEIFPRVVRRYVRNGANFIVNITEDSWFGRTSGPFQHFEMSIFRAIEYKRPVIRCANSGVSGFIDPHGRIRKETHIFTREIVPVQVHGIETMTIYARIGDLFAWLFLLFAGFSIYYFLKRDYYKHRTAIVERYAEVGKGTKIWHFSHIMGKVGENCVIGQNCFVGRDAVIGNGVKLENGVNVFSKVTIEEDVFVGPEATFTNDINPRALFPKGGKWIPTLVKRGATIGANATILPGVTIGKWSMIGAGSVVTRDVPDFAIVRGNPARHTGWICICGRKLEFDNKKAVCSGCGREYRIKDGRVEAVS